MTPTHKLAYRFFAQTVVLLVLYAAVSLLGAAKFLSPDDPLAYTLPYSTLGGLANVLLNLTALTGLVGGGIYMAFADNTDDDRLLEMAGWLWTALVVLALGAGLLGLLEGRSLLEVPPLLDLLEVLALAFIVFRIVRHTPRTPVMTVWAMGMGISIVSTLIGLIPPGDYLADRVLRTLAVGLNLNVAYPLAAFALGYWLMRRFSHVLPAWADIGVYTVGGLVTLAGVLVTLPPLFRFGAEEISITLGNIALIAVPALYLIVAAHCYAALSNRNDNPGLSAHWFALSLLLFLLGIGLLGGLAAAPGIGQWTVGTRLTDLQSTLTLLAAVAMSLGIVNQGSAELYGKNRRITGLTPFWLVAFGGVGGGLALAAAGVAQVYMERLLSIGYLDVQNMIAPLYALWTVGLLLFAAGAGVLALAFWARRPVDTGT